MKTNNSKNLFSFVKFFLANRKNNILQVVDFSIIFSVIIILNVFSIINSLASVILIITFLFIWSARYGLLLFLFSITFFEIIFVLLYANKELGIDSWLLSSYAIVVGLILGIVGEILNKKIRTLENDKKRLELENKELLENVNKLQSIINQLQLRVFFEGEGMITLLERLKELEVLDLDEILTRSVEIIADFFQLSNLQLYRVDKNFLRFVAGVGEKRLQNSFTVDKSKVISKAIERGYSTLPEVILESEFEYFEPWFCVAIGKKDDIAGVLAVEDIQPENFSETLVQYISAVASWLHANIKVIAEQEALLTERFKEPDGTWKEEYYLRKKAIFEKRRERFGIEFKELCLKYRKEYHELIIKEFRASDVLHSKKNGEIVTTKVLLPVCDEIGKQKVLERLAKAYEISIC